MQTSIHISHFETTAGKFVAGNAMSFLFPFSISSSDLKQLAGMGIIFGRRLQSRLIQAGGEQQKSHLGTKGHSKVAALTDNRDIYQKCQQARIQSPPPVAISGPRLSCQLMPAIDTRYF